MRVKGRGECRGPETGSKGFDGYGGPQMGVNELG